MNCLIIDNDIVGELILNFNLEHILILDCSNKNITKITNFPSKLEELICVGNQIKYLDNLPNTLKYLDCYSNPIENLNYLPDSLLILKCSYCIEPLNNLPINLIELECEMCIVNLSSLQNLKFFRGVYCKSEINGYQVIPKKMSKLILDRCKNMKINFDIIPESLHYIYCNHEDFKNHIYDSETLDKNLCEFKKKYPNIFITSSSY